MEVFIVLGLIWVAHGVVGIYGIQKIPTRFVGKKWTKQYVRFKGKSKILLGTSWIILGSGLLRLMEVYHFNLGMMMSVCLFSLVPYLVYSFVEEHHYLMLLQKEEEAKMEMTDGIVGKQ